MPYTIAVAGKGGVGKTTFAALLVRYLIKIDSPVLAVDADPNANLNVLLGLKYENTIADIREEARALDSVSLSKREFFSMKLEEIVAEADGMDLLVMGRPEGSGCYCAVNNMLRDYLSTLSKNYRFVVIDNEAGMEHLSRRTVNPIDMLVFITDKSMVGVYSAINASIAAKKAGLKVKNMSMVINKSKGALEENKVKLIEKSGLKISGEIPFADEIEKRSETGAAIKDINVPGIESIFRSLLKPINISTEE